MTPMLKLMPRTTLFSTIVLLLAIAPVHAQNFDNSGTANLTGQYLFRYVNFFNDQSGNLTESCTLSGIIAFDGRGNYTLQNTQLFDSAGSNGTGFCASAGTGSYGVQSNGIAQLDNPLYAATLFGTFSQPVLIASSTEDDYFDLFIAVQAPQTAFSNGSLSGAFTVGTLDFLNASASLARQGYFTLNADGQGNLAAFTVNGSAANLSAGGNITQNVGASTYSLSGTTGGTVTFPGSSGDQTQIVSGAKLLYVSADGNWFVGGSATGSDMFFGFRAPTGTSSNALLSGTYFMAGYEDFVGSPPDFLDAFYGSVNSNGDGNLIWHERFDDVADIITYDFTFAAPVTIGADGSYYDGSTYTYLAGANGAALMLIGSNQQFSLIVGTRAPSITPASSVWIDPTGITNSANYTPITNAYAPGELVSLFGTFGVSTQVDQVFPVPTTLGNVQVFVNGQAAPVYQVSQNQISALIPYGIAGDFFATFQVIVNGTKSNEVTVYVDNTAPGLYTLSESGIGAGAILHPDFTEVTDSSPAMPGETVSVFMNGLGTVTPPLGDGAAAPSSPLSNADEAAAIFVFLVDGVDAPAFATVAYAGLAPGFAGLYQVNLTLPASGLTNGDVTIVFNTNEATNSMSTISLAGFSDTGGRVVPTHGVSRLMSRAVPASAARGKHAKNFRRALPERSKE
jgi:uncharacterized protein (TIGR03437 family)